MMRRAVCLYHRIYINARVCCSRWFTDGVEGIHHRLHRCGLWRHRYPQIGRGRYRCVSVSVGDGISAISGQECRGGDSPPIAQMRRKRRHRYPQIGEDIVVYPCPSETASVLSVVKNVVEGIHHRLHRCGASSDTDIHGLGKVSVSAEDGIRFISGSENTVRRGAF